MSSYHEQSLDTYLGFRNSDFNDKRLTNRLCLIAKRIAQQPDKSNPQSMGDDAATEAFYRFINNEKVDIQSILSGHIDAVRKRVDALDKPSLPIVIHDTTTITPQTPRAGMGKVSGEKSKHGFLAHVSIAAQVTPGRRARPLGVTNVISWTRGEGDLCLPHEPDRWIQGVEDSAQVVGKSAVHVMDREGDNQDIWGALVKTKKKYVVRCKAGKKTSEGRISELLQAHGCFVCRRQVTLHTRKTSQSNKTHPPRKQRTAELTIKSGYVRLPTREGYQDMHAVMVYEEHPPEGQAGVNWCLLTNLPIKTQGDVARIVDIYCARWLIEEVFKCLKTGCQFEKQQLESIDAFLATLGINLPIAVRVVD